MPNPATFERYFHDRAELAEQLYRDGWRHEAVLIASVAIDALANICEHDQKTPGAGHLERFRSFVEHYSADADARKIAVVFLAEDMIRHGPPRLHDVARSLLAKRNVDPGDKIARPMEFATSPFAHLDAEWSALVVQECALSGESKIEALATERYTYAALVYSLTRCAVAHALSRGSRTSATLSEEVGEDTVIRPELREGGGALSRGAGRRGDVRGEDDRTLDRRWGRVAGGPRAGGALESSATARTRRRIDLSAPTKPTGFSASGGWSRRRQSTDTASPTSTSKSAVECPSAWSRSTSALARA